MQTSHLIWGMLCCAFLSGCELTAKQPIKAETKTVETQFIAVEQHHTCDYVPDMPDLIFHCVSGSEGRHEILHPIDDFEYTLAQQAKNKHWHASKDIWQAIKNQLDFPVPDNKRVRNQLNWYKKNPAYMARVNKRATPFLFHIVKAIEKQKMPMELVLLPIVESAFDPFAYSHGRAAGMWQFIPGTGKRFGLKQNWWYDGRRDAIAATDGALKYLSYLHKLFDGNWLHALAAYNSGEGRVLKAIKKNKRAGKPIDFWSLDLPKETRAYVPKLLALSELLKNSNSYAFPWPTLPYQPFTEIVAIGSQIDLALAAEMAGLSVEALHAVNPGFNRWATDPKGPHRLLIPSENVAQFKQALTQTESKDRLNWVRHKVKNGESLLKIAQTYHTSVDVIQQVNKINGNVIRAGDHMLIPVALKSLDYYSLSADERLKSTQNRRRGDHRLTHMVDNGDTLWDISRFYKVNVRALAKWNGMAPTDPLKPGKQLIIWVNKLPEQQINNTVMRSVTYTVRRGDSLARIADKFNLKIVDITRWNKLKKARYLQPGQKLKLYIDVTKT